MKYDDVDGAEQTVPNVDNASYELLTDDLGSYVRFKDTYSYPSLDTDRPALRVAYVAGYGTNAADVPAPIRHAILMLVGHWFANREAIAVGVAPSVVPLGVEALLAPYRRVRF